MRSHLSPLSQRGASFEPLLRHIAAKTPGAAQVEGTASPPDPEAALRDALQQVDSFGVEGTTPVNAEEVKCCNQLESRTASASSAYEI